MAAKASEKTTAKAVTTDATTPEAEPVTDSADTADMPAVVDDRSETEKRAARGECVVDDGTPHTGRAVDGLICSAHSMRYRADGTLRSGGR